VTTSQASVIPSHVPAELIVDYDPVNGPEINAFPPAVLDGLRDTYRIFYTTFQGGYWVLTRHEDIRAAYEDPELFPQGGTLSHQSLTHQALIPLSLNPPLHRQWRKVLQPMFTPGRLRQLEGLIRETARDRLREIGPRGRCDVATEFAIALPAATFCGLLGLPREQFPSFNQLAFDLVYTPEKVRREQGDEAALAYRQARSMEIAQLVAGLIPARRAEPGDDVITFLLDARFEGRPLTAAEIVNIASLLFFAGTDSTGAMITYSLAFLAEHPAHKQRLIDEPAIIPRATDELIRYHAFHHLPRDVARDAEFAGVQLKRGDRIMLPTGGANHDSRFYPPNAAEVDFDRKTAGMITFGAGPHRCLGAPLATLQVKIALDEVIATIPDFTLDPDGPVDYVCMANKAIPQHVPLVYSPVSVP
jgi:cytochrome P450